MLIRVGRDRTEKINLGLAGVLSLIAGALNAVGFLVAGSFTANMTGNISLFTEHLAKQETVLALSFLGLIGAFLCGAGVAAFAIQSGVRLGVRSVYAWVITAEATVLLALGVGFLVRPGSAPDADLVILLSFVLGLQNAATTLISGARVRTTHVSGIITDLGIEIATWLGNEAVRSDTVPRLRLYGLTLACFAVGGIVGTMLFTQIGAWMFLIAASGLLALSLPQLVRAHFS
ncbi:YoaK family protein [Tranquillimonas rosea]|uniref:YoaK family protein n=1 Tax=Tranquillimonas rosea TaxID=641238 RepID=UPI003BAD6F08